MNLSAYEWVAFGGGDPGSDIALAIAPSRWLVVAPPAAWLAERAQEERVGHGALIDVSGRWVPVDIAHNPHVLSGAAPLELILKDREVASLWIHDCPVLIVRCNGETRVLVEASYAHSLRAMLARL
jgi:sarcosine oxidase gamma subunit